MRGNASEGTLRAVWPRLSAGTRFWFIVSGWINHDGLPLFELKERLAKRAKEEGDLRYRTVIAELEEAAR